MLPAEIKTILNRVMVSSPSDIKLVAQRIHDHAVTDRMSSQDMEQTLSELGYPSIRAFCRDAGLPAHVAERWERFGIAADMQQVLTHMVTERRRFLEAVEAFESMTHVGLTDFLRDRGIL